MRKTLFSAFFILIVAHNGTCNPGSFPAASQGQHPKPFLPYLLADRSKFSPFIISDTPGQGVMNKSAGSGLMADGMAIFSHRNSLGSVYRLSEDKMPCFVPDLAKLEHISGQKFNVSPNGDRMPNVFPRQKFFVVPKIK
jgi:hypothetical protein